MSISADRSSSSSPQTPQRRFIVDLSPLRSSHARLDTNILAEHLAVVRPPKADAFAAAEAAGVSARHS